MSGVGDQGLRPAHVEPQPPDDEQVEAEEAAREEPRRKHPAEPPVEPSADAARGQDRSASDPDHRSQRNP